MMVFEYNIITGMSYYWVDDIPTKKDYAMSKKQQLDNILTSLRLCNKNKAYI